MTDSNHEALLASGHATDVWVIHVISEKQAEYHGAVWGEVLAEHWQELSPKYKFATVEYEGDTSILLTKWCIWRTPFLIFVTDHGQQLRFLTAMSISNRPEQLYLLLSTDAWKDYAQVWQSPFAPGEWAHPYMVTLGKGFATLHNSVGRVPSWILLVAVAGLGKLLRDSIHKDRVRATVEYEKAVRKAEGASPAEDFAAARIKAQQIRQLADSKKLKAA